MGKMCISVVGFLDHADLIVLCTFDSWMIKPCFFIVFSLGF